MEPTRASTERRIPAIPVSRGIGIGHVRFLPSSDDAIYRANIAPEAVNAEIARLREALAKTREELAQRGQSDIVEVQSLILNDAELLGEIEALITREFVNAEWALKTVADTYQRRQASVGNPEFREKSLDIEDAAQRVILSLLGSSRSSGNVFDAIVVARELRPSAMIELGSMRPAAIITERAGWTSHASILAREYALPMVSGLNAAQYGLNENDLVIVDGVNGEIIIDPELSTVEEFRGKSFERDMRPSDRSVSSGVVMSRDGIQIAVRANVDSVQAYNTAKRAGVVGIGLFRSESLLENDGTLPSEDSQAAVYRSIAAAVDDGDVNIRTFDVGIEYFNGRRRKENNPSLGLRAIRLGLRREQDLRVQFRAVLRAATEGNFGIILPMISGVDDVRDARRILEEEYQDLDAAAIPSTLPRLGVMIEVPSAVFTAADIADEVDFLCLGTNDLVQYLLAVDRDNDAIAGLYKTLHPAVLSAIRIVIDAGRETETPVIVCGEMAGSPFYVPVLLGLGATELSITVGSIRPVRHLIAGIMVEECQSLVERSMGCKTAGEIETILHDHYASYWEHLFPPGLLNTRHH